jgi:hypothetical protein
MKYVFWYFFISVVILFVLLHFFRIKKWATPVKAPMRQTPLQIALFELKIARKNIAENSSKIFMELLTFAVKNYLSAKFDYIDGAKTNGEILAKFANDVSNDLETLGLLTEIFSLDDEVKFAGRKLSLRRQHEIYKKTCQLVLCISRSKKGVLSCK